MPFARRFVHVRIIPAYAGSTMGRPCYRVADGDHPRVCGEHRVVRPHWHECVGSSPRMRGALGVPVEERKRIGIIPAYAGSTCLTTNGNPVFWDHPRVCGEHPVSESYSKVGGGSSPRMRGALRQNAPNPILIRIIPAYAGST